MQHLNLFIVESKETQTGFCSPSPYLRKRNCVKMSLINLECKEGQRHKTHQLVIAGTQ